MKGLLTDDVNLQVSNNRKATTLTEDRTFNTLNILYYLAPTGFKLIIYLKFIEKMEYSPTDITGKSLNESFCFGNFLEFSWKHIRITSRDV